MATSIRCPKCLAEVSTQNYELHEARCPGKRAVASPSSAQQSQAALATDSSGPTPSQLVQALTWARTSHEEVVAALRKRKEHYNGKQYFPPNRDGRCVVTKEGVAAVEDAIAFVLALEPMDGVGDSSERGLAFAAEDHIADIGRTGAVSHTSANGTCAADRAKRYGSFRHFGECLWYGSERADARTIIMDLIVDDGVPSRGHRKGVFNPVYDVVGSAYGPHATFGKMAALEFAEGWCATDMFIRARMQSGPYQMDQKAMAKAMASAESQWSLGSCAICNQQIKGGKVVEVAQLGGKLHADCFKCSVCSTSLAGGKFKAKDRVPFCQTCFHDKHGEKCHACGEVITDGTMKCSLGVFHPQCVICNLCGKAIGKGTFSTTSGAITCNTCVAAASGGRGDRSNRPGRSSPTGALATAGGAIASSTGGLVLSRPGSATSGRPISSSPRVTRAGTGVAKSRAKSCAAMAPKQRAAPKPKAKVNMGLAKSTVVGLGMDYGSLV
eukprot:TRINITY_DN12738_c0_g1_i1.p1 TRINITY_DN12738_c0_g1~~TRINITY_DN12738_c0_g1_i1.p1  ORF type:complete len:497 (+),score=75.93 TRINITY_DN12738_c0_g1_i1:139-1629(+)